jgi:hypothetical protein
MFRYLQGLIDLFGKFDQDQDGVVEFNEFRDLWTHLGGEPPIVGAAAAAVKGEQLDAARSKEFSKFDLNADGVLSARGATATHPPGLCLSLSLSLSLSLRLWSAFYSSGRSVMARARHRSCSVARFQAHLSVAACWRERRDQGVYGRAWFPGAGRLRAWSDRQLRGQRGR